MGVRIYHNRRCSKSRQTLSLLRERGIEPEIVEYLKAPPDAEELERLLGMLGLEPSRLIDAMVEHPQLIERPILVKEGRQAALGRPLEAGLEIL